jgi:NADPH2:quinone reductase
MTGIDRMQIVIAPVPGGPEALAFAERPVPAPGPTQLLVRVRAIGINRAEAMQRAGRYAPPPGESDVLGLELAGEVAARGDAATRFAVGDRVFGLVASGAYAEFALVDEGLAVAMPEAWDFATAAAVIETHCTANETLFTVGRLARGESVLVHAGGSGVGTTAIQMAREAGATVYATAGSRAKLERALQLGARAAIDYHEEDFAAALLRLTQGRGVDVVLDFIGASYMPRHLQLLRETGRLVLVGLLGPASHPIDTSPILHKRLRVEGFTLRPQSVAAKRAIVARFVERWMKPLETGAIRPLIYRRLAFSEIREAHRMLEANENTGKIVVTLP